MEVIKILLEIPLFSLLFFVYARIGIGTIGIAANTHHVLTIKSQTAKPLQQHRPRNVPGWPTEWLPYAMRIPLQG